MAAAGRPCAAIFHRRVAQLPALAQLLAIVRRKRSQPLILAQPIAGKARAVMIVAAKLGVELHDLLRNSLPASANFSSFCSLAARSYKSRSCAMKICFGSGLAAGWSWSRCSCERRRRAGAARRSFRTVGAARGVLAVVRARRADSELLPHPTTGASKRNCRQGDASGRSVAGLNAVLVIGPIHGLGQRRTAHGACQLQSGGLAGFSGLRSSATRSTATTNSTCAVVAPRWATTKLCARRPSAAA